MTTDINTIDERARREVREALNANSMETILTRLLGANMYLEARLDQLTKAPEVLVIPCQLLSPYARVPRVMQSGDVAADLYAIVRDANGRVIETVTLEPGSYSHFGTGLAMELPAGFRGTIESRSGLALKQGIEVGAGVIDQRYRQEIGVILYNHGSEPFDIATGMRIAQLSVWRYIAPEFRQVERLESTDRAGFGSSGLH